MTRSVVNQFAIETDIPLSFLEEPSPLSKSEDRPTIKVYMYADDCETVTHLHWIGRRYGGALCAYDAESAIIVTTYGGVRMRVSKSADDIAFNLPNQSLDEWHSLDQAIQFAEKRALAAAMTVNLGVSICTLFRNEIPIHAAGVVSDGHYFAIAAPSGTGKSTLLWALLDRGALFANDDVVPVRTVEDQIIASPSLSLPGKLERHALEERGIDLRRVHPVFPRSDEFWVPLSREKKLQVPQSLDALFLLQPFRGAGNRVLVRRLDKEQAKSALMSHIQGLWCTYPCLDTAAIFAEMESIAGKVKVYVVHYRRHLAVLPELIDAILAAVKTPKSDAAL